MRLNAFLAVALALTLPGLGFAQHEKKSSFGIYAGYTTETYDGYLRESFFIEMRDGVELAYDLYRPTKGGELGDEPLPLVWTHDRYHRALASGDSAIATKVLGYPWLSTMINQGYLVAAVDVRGGGASFGTWQGIFNEEETKDAYEIVEWFAEQEWCDGNIGMYGGSYLGGTQFMAASRKPPHLKALFPFVAPTDLYDIAWNGGVFRDDLVRDWGELTHMLDRSPAVATIEFDDGGEARQAALAEHEGNLAFEKVVAMLPHRDSRYDGKQRWRVQSPISYIDEIEESGVAVYHQGGWFDPFSRDAFVMYRNLDNPQKIIMGPWFHTESFGIDWNAEAIRWYDYWLKGIDNGVMDDPPIHYWTVGAPEGEEWRATNVWPLENEQRTPFFFSPGPSGSIDSVNDGLLDTGVLMDAGRDAYTVDYTTSSGRITRWSSAVGQGGPNPAYRDQRKNDARSLTYTTGALADDLEVTGHPVVHLWVTVPAEDGDFFVLLEEVLPDGTSEVVSEGVLRASKRALTDPPHDTMGLPYHGSEEADARALPERAFELAFDLFPTSNIFDRGHRMRVTVMCADDENALTPPIEPAPEVFVHLGGERPSYIDLPVIP